MYINMYFSKVLGVYNLLIFFTYKIFKFMFVIEELQTFVIEETCEILHYLTFSVRSTDFSPLLWFKGIDNGICGVLTLISRGLHKVMVQHLVASWKVRHSIKDKESIPLAFDFPINASSLLKHTRFFLL